MEKAGKRKRMGAREKSGKEWGAAGEEWKGSQLYHRRRSDGKNSSLRVGSHVFSFISSACSTIQGI